MWVVDEEDAERPDMRLMVVAVAGPLQVEEDTPGDTTPNAFVPSTKTASKSNKQSILQYKMICCERVPRILYLRRLLFDGSRRIGTQITFFLNLGCRTPLTNQVQVTPKIL